MPTSPLKFLDTVVPSSLLPATPRALTSPEVEKLWELFHAIGEHWKNTTQQSVGQRSSWTEFIMLRAESSPSYIAEYESALQVIAELLEELEGDAYRELFQHKTAEKDQPWTRMDHAKHYVVDEFIRMQIVAAGFRGFGSDAEGKNRQDYRPKNYNGFIRGSRYTRHPQARTYSPKASEQ